MRVNENQLMLLALLRSELATLRTREQIDPSELVALLEQIKEVTEIIICHDEATRLLRVSLLETVTIFLSWAQKGDLEVALSSTLLAVSRLLVKQDLFG